MKRGLVILLLSLIVITQLNAVSAQAPGGLDSDALKNDSVVRSVEQLQDLTQKERLDYLGEQWKASLLKWKPLAVADAFFQKINWAFLFLFGRNYELSLALFFAVAIWLITFFVGKKFFVFFRAEWMRYAASFAATVIIAQIQIFNALANLMLRMYFYKYEWWWKALIFLVELVVLILYLGFLRYFGKVVEAQKKKKDAQKLAMSEKKINVMADELTDASKSKLP